jgi:hypothetical protein
MKYTCFLTLSALTLLTFTGCTGTKVTSKVQPQAQAVAAEVTPEEKPVIAKSEVLTSKQGQKALVETTDGFTDNAVYDAFATTAVTKFGSESEHSGYGFFANSNYESKNPTSEDKAKCFIAWSKLGTKLNDPAYLNFTDTGCKLEEFNLNLQSIMDKNKVEVVYFSERGKTSWGRFVLVQNIK